MAKYLVIQLPDDASGVPIAEWLDKNMHLKAVPVEMETEFGRHFQGMGGEVLPVGTSRPSVTEDRYRRLIGPWEKIEAGEWYGYNNYRPKNV